MKKHTVRLSKEVAKQFKGHKVPKNVVAQAIDWQDAVVKLGLVEVRKIKSYHDEPLKGQLAGLRSVRLNIQWRLWYAELDETELDKDARTGKTVAREIVLVLVTKVSPHDYR